VEDELVLLEQVVHFYIPIQLKKSCIFPLYFLLNHGIWKP
jgi:hypothetical protein